MIIELAKGAITETDGMMTRVARMTDIPTRKIHAFGSFMGLRNIALVISVLVDFWLPLFLVIIWYLLASRLTMSWGKITQIRRGDLHAGLHSQTVAYPDRAQDLIAPQHGPPWRWVLWKLEFANQNHTIEPVEAEVHHIGSS